MSRIDGRICCSLLIGTRIIFQFRYVCCLIESKVCLSSLEFLVSKNNTIFIHGRNE